MCENEEIIDDKWLIFTSCIELRFAFWHSCVYKFELEMKPGICWKMLMEN